LEAGADVHSVGEWGGTPLHQAARGDDPENVHNILLLIEAGAELGALAEGGTTPLHWAANWGAPANITTLLNAGADASMRTEEGLTAFDIAKGNDAVKGTTVYWELNDDRFE